MEEIIIWSRAEFLSLFTCRESVIYMVIIVILTRRNRILTKNMFMLHKL